MYHVKSFWSGFIRFDDQNDACSVDALYDASPCFSLSTFGWSSLCLRHSLFQCPGIPQLCHLPFVLGLKPFWFARSCLDNRAFSLVTGINGFSSRFCSSLSNLAVTNSNIRSSARDSKAVIKPLYYVNATITRLYCIVCQ